MTTVQRTNRNASGGSRRRLAPDEEREIARLYSEARTSPAEIRGRFGIAESSVYRVLQKQGVSLRGRTGRAVGGAVDADSMPATGRKSRGRSSRGTSDGLSPRRGTQTSVSADGATRHFRVRFAGVRVVDAQDISDALRQAEAFGASDVFELTRVD